MLTKEMIINKNRILSRHISKKLPSIQYIYDVSMCVMMHIQSIVSLMRNGNKFIGGDRQNQTKPRKTILGNNNNKHK